MNINKTERKLKRKSARLIFSSIGACAITCLFILGATSANAADNHAKMEKKKSHQHAAKEMEGPHYLPSSDFIGTEVVDEKGNHIGEVYDLMVNLEKEDAPFVVVSFNDILGYGGDLFALPWEGVTHLHKDDACVLSIRKENEVPSREDQDWIGLESDKGENAKNVSEFGMTPYWVKEDEAKEAKKSNDHPQSHLLSANDLLGSDVTGQDEESLGTVSEIVLHSNDGAIACSVLSFGDIAGIGGSLRPVPVSLLKKQEDGSYSLNTDKEAILKAPAYDSETTLKEMDRSWVEKVHEHYGVEMMSHERHDYAKPRTSKTSDTTPKSRAIAARDSTDEK
ncbi:MAG: PRC-barrel domain-containing protein [Candidatus Omnitrophica bacterium]|nr:PRC-barrel domain-containing protein [Candidatus Omnitrophota bacterium]